MGRKSGLSCGKKPRVNSRENVPELKALLKVKEELLKDLMEKYEEEKGYKTKYENLVTERLAQFEQIEDLKVKYEELKSKYEALKAEKGVENDLKVKLKAKNEEIEVLGIDLRHKDTTLKAKIKVLEMKEEDLKKKIEEIKDLKSRFQYEKVPRTTQPENPSYEHVIYNLKNYEELISKVLTFP